MFRSKTHYATEQCETMVDDRAQPRQASAPNTLDLRVSCDIAQLSGLMAQIIAFAKQHAWSESDSLQVQLLVEELLVNAMTHGAVNKPNAWAWLIIRNATEGIHIELCDNGIPFNPLTLAAPDIDLDLDSREIGGLGIHFVRQLGDDLHYVRTTYLNEDINKLIIFKKWA